MQFKRYYEPQNILPENCLQDLSRCLEFFQNFDKDCMPDNNHKLMALLDEVSDILKAMNEALAVYKFLGQVQMCRSATNDNEIYDHSDAFENQLHRYKDLARHVENIHARLVHAISAKYS